jgi:sec-independent protein translocase protein TatA
MFGDLLSPMHIIVLLLVALLIFGPKRLPEIGQGVGKAIRDFKDTVNGVTKPSEGSTPPVPATVTASPATAPEALTPEASPATSQEVQK